MKVLVLTARDMDLLALLALHREISLDELARLFSKNPFTGAVNRTPDKQCARRLRELQAAGYVTLSHVHDGRRRRLVARVASKADAPLDERAARRTLSDKGRVHHLKTLEAVRLVEEEMRKRGGRVLEFRVEATIRAEAFRGRRTRRGDAFDSFPDAVCTVALPSMHGERVARIAIEYVTNKYCDADIRAKHESFGGTYDQALWFADKHRTAARVRRLTGGSCSILS